MRRQRRLQHVLGAVQVDPQAFQRMLDDAPHPHRSGQVDDPVGSGDGPGDQMAVQDGPLDQMETLMIHGLGEVGQRSGGEVVEHGDVVADGQ